jgi:hypothetical protein
MGDGVLEPWFWEVGVVAHDDLKLWCELVRDVVQQAEEAAYGRAVSVVFGDATLQGDFGGIVRLGRLVKYEESRYWPVLPGQVPVER